ncbi:MAG: NTP transferase domain-containing protein [Ignavibacteria bacterium]|jgi:UDP-N-acetylglucosamine diphosphorylase/glucosamine-1-phosphate N-acetyltransferase
MSNSLAVAILAAGQGKRMGNPNLAKVLNPLHGQPLLGHVLAQAATLAPSHVVVIIGHQRDAVQEFVASTMPSAVCVVQEQQLGTGHAVQQTHSALAQADCDVLILSGDVPLLTKQTLASFTEHHTSTGSVVSVLTANVPDPTGYGRIIRNEHGELQRIVEHKDATEDERLVAEINSGIYIVHSSDLFEALDGLSNNNAQGEYYLTDIVSILLSRGKSVSAWLAPSWEELHGINTIADLERAGQILSERGSQ